jgi:hypothetical protein
MLQFYSSYYEKQITLNRDEAEILLDLYHTIANNEGFESEADSIHDLEYTYDHVAYHVDEFGRGLTGYSELEHLFE